MGLNPGVLETASHAGLDQRLGRERMLFNARATIEQYQALQKAAGCHRLQRSDPGEHASRQPDAC